MILIVPFSRKYDRTSFDCGVESLNEWLKLQAGQQERKGNTRTFLAVDGDSQKVLGYYASLVSEVSQNNATTWVPAAGTNYSRPAIRLARFAVALVSQDRGLGSILLQHFFDGALSVAKQVGVEIITVDALNGAARDFYIRQGFTPAGETSFVLSVRINDLIAIRKDV